MYNTSMKNLPMCIFYTYIYIFVVPLRTVTRETGKSEGIAQNSIGPQAGIKPGTLHATGSAYIDRALAGSPITPPEPAHC